jgi:hypothetical protein
VEEKTKASNMWKTLLLVSLILVYVATGWRVYDLALLYGWSTVLPVCALGIMLALGIAFVVRKLTPED